MDTGILDEAYERFSGTGPEWGEDQLTNHGPMAAEVLVRRGHAGDVHRWVDRYLRRLDELPTATDRITTANWRDALGDGRRVGDWTAYLRAEAADKSWQELLTTWWPRLLPGIAAGATHGVIRTSHAVRALLAGDSSQAAVTELASGLAFWAARSLAVPAAVGPASAGPAGGLDAAGALGAIPRVPEQAGNVAARFGQLPGMPGWAASLAALRAPADPDEARDLLAGLVDAATVHYLGHGHASPVLLVHTATAPNAVLRVLPALPRDQWSPSLAAVWAASAAITAAYAPAVPVVPENPTGDVTRADTVEDVIERSVAHGDEHVIKFTDTAADVFRRSGDPAALAAADRVAELLGRPR